MLKTRSPFVNHLSNFLVIGHQIFTVTVKQHLSLGVVHSKQATDPAVVARLIVSSFLTLRGKSLPWPYVVENSARTLQLIDLKTNAQNFPFGILRPLFQAVMTAKP